MRSSSLCLAVFLSMSALPTAVAAQAMRCDEFIDTAGRAATNAQLAAHAAAASRAEAAAPLARVLPHVTASGTLVRNDRQIAIALPPPLAVDPPPILQQERSLRASLEARATLLDGAFFPLRRAAVVSADAAEYDADAAVNAARRAAVQLCATNAELAARTEVLAAHERAVAAHAHQVALLLEVGLALPLDVQRAELARLDAELERLRIEAARRQVARTAASLLGRDGTIELADALPEVATSAADSSAVAAAAARADAAHHVLRSLRLEYAPRLVASGQLAVSDTEAIDGERTSWQLGLSLQWSIYAGQSRRAQVRSAAARLLAAERVADEARRAHARSQAEDADTLDLLAAAASLEAERGAVAAAAATLAQQALAAGALAPTDALDAELRASAADAAARSASIELWRARWEAALR